MNKILIFGLGVAAGWALASGKISLGLGKNFGKSAKQVALENPELPPVEGVKQTR